MKGTIERLKCSVETTFSIYDLHFAKKIHIPHQRINQKNTKYIVYINVHFDLFVNVFFF